MGTSEYSDQRGIWRASAPTDSRNRQWTQVGLGEKCHHCEFVYPGIVIILNQTGELWTKITLIYSKNPTLNGPELKKPVVGMQKPIKISYFHPGLVKEGGVELLVKI